ncbi:MAG: serine hydrolase [Sphingomonas sp.]|uniref:serine hydrolase n=1 Tax=Sphingomonas sp. TaxID=28214 RepID=UPI003F7D86C6
MVRFLASFLIAAIALPAIADAQTPPAAIAPAADPSLTARANELISVIAGSGDFAGYFSPAFHAALPKAKWDAVVASMTGQMGKPLAIDGLKPVTPFSAYLRIRFERGVVNAQIAVDPAPPHQVAGLLFTGTEVAGDTLEKLVADVRALPGKTGLGIYELGKGAPKLVSGIDPNAAAPLGSAFKLWVLGELAREVGAAERHWADVVPVGPASLPSGITQSWPAGSPATVQTLATLMISISDNTATDTLVTLEGPKLDEFVARTGAPGLAPVVTTRQMFALKTPANADLAAQWATELAPTARRRLIESNAARLATTTVDPMMFAGKPAAIDTLEWFASPAQTAGMLDWLRADGGATALSLLAVNPGIDPTTRGKFDYVGFKGGSEPGVLTLNYLVKRKDGRWLAVVGAWHRGDAGVEEARFVQLMTRALVLVSDGALPD